ncbi:MAG: hypothetical protein H0U45_06515 [Tatlockia sp.]|nr:hypothetical protein [Tatlockia sp.]
MVHDNAAKATGCGTGAIAQLLLTEQLKRLGVWAVEQALPTNLFEQTLASRGLTIHQEWLQ